MSDKRFTIDYSPDVNCISLFDNEEESVIVMDIAQVEAIIDWYSQEFHKFII